METYSLLRFFADSWMLIFMTALFVAVVIFAFRPGSSKEQNDAANSIFRNEKRPASGDAESNSGPKFKEALK